MKKIMFLVVIALLFISCEGDEGPMGPQGPGTNWKIINLQANASDWKEYSDGNKLNRYYSCTFTVPEINAFVFSSGTVVSYIKIGTAQQSLPYVRHYENTDGVLWTRTVDFEYANGSATYFVTNSDFANDPPESMQFRLVLMW